MFYNKCHCWYFLQCGISCYHIWGGSNCAHTCVSFELRYNIQTCTLLFLFMSNTWMSALPLVVLLETFGDCILASNISLRLLCSIHGQCAIIMFDVTARLTYKNVPTWHRDLCRWETLHSLPAFLLNFIIDDVQLYLKWLFHCFSQGLWKHPHCSLWKQSWCQEQAG